MKRRKQEQNKRGNFNRLKNESKMNKEEDMMKIAEKGRF